MDEMNITYCQCPVHRTERVYHQPKPFRDYVEEKAGHHCID